MLKFWNNFVFLLLGVNHLDWDILFCKPFSKDNAEVNFWKTWYPIQCPYRSASTPCANCYFYKPHILNEHIYTYHRNDPGSGYRNDYQCMSCSMNFHCPTLRNIHRFFCPEEFKEKPFPSKYWFNDQVSHGLELCEKQKGKKPRCLDPRKFLE